MRQKYTHLGQNIEKTSRLSSPTLGTLFNSGFIINKTLKYVLKPYDMIHLGLEVL